MLSFAVLWEAVKSVCICACLVSVFAVVPASFSSVYSVEAGATTTGDLSDIEIESSNVHENVWNSEVELAADGAFRLLWKTSEHRIVFLAEVRTRGYFELGFSVNGRASDADIVVGWVNDGTKKPYLVDCHGDKSSRMPVKDVVQNYELLNGYQNNTHTVLMFTRLWNTCDKRQDITIRNDTIKLLWAFNDGDDPIDDTLSNIVWHDKEVRGSRSFNLKNPSSSKRQLKGVKHLDLRLSDANVAHNTTTAFWCQIFKPPTMNTKHHVTGYTPILDEKNSDLLRHMILYECQDRAASPFQMSRSKGFACEKKLSATKNCATPVLVWASGSEGEFFPKHVGLPMGEDPRQYYMLELHYNNPSLRKVVDNSGIRLYYTENLRKHDGGVFVTGAVVSPLSIIPPYQEAYRTAGYCDKYCTKTAIPMNGINSISVVLHSHSAARKIRLRHFRQGEELAPIVQDDNYDYNYQQSRELPREVTIFPEDELVTECTYNTVNRTYPTLGGYSMKQETCLAYITYYPKISLTSCQSMNPIELFFSTYGIKQFYDYDISMIEKIFTQLTEKEANKRQIEGANDLRTSTMIRLIEDNGVEESEESNLFLNLVISEPSEFQNKTFSRHLHDLPWKEIYKNLERMFYYGRHRVFCRWKNSSLAMPASEYPFPKVIEYKVPNEEDLHACRVNAKNKKMANNSSSRLVDCIATFLLVVYAGMTISIF